MNTVPDDLRARLEDARLELRALYRALDRMLLAQDLPEELRRLQELDAGFAEALWVLDQPPERFDLAAMTRESLSSLRQMTDGRERLLALFDASTRAQLEDRVQAMRRVLSLADAYLEIPGGGGRGG